MLFLKNYSVAYLKQDIPAGIIVALVSIPISIGYAQIAGLPPVYGLYGSLFPILIYGLLSTSPRFVFGVDAAPAALVGGTLAEMGIASQSQEAMAIVPVITFLAAMWLFLFYLVGMGKFVKFISSPVMGGFITGISCTIILMQIPKLYGGTAGEGELPQLVRHFVASVQDGVNLLSLVLGVGTVAVILICQRLISKIPMSVVMMVVGALLTVVFHVNQYGVNLLPEVSSGLPKFIVPSFGVVSGNLRTMLVSSLSVALVILCETLLATNNFALKYNDKINNNREILAYACGNLAASLMGCCPVNGSVSRSGIANQFGVKSQMMSVSAFATMLMILLFGTGFIGFLPVPVLTGIVIAALINSLEFNLAAKLRKYDKIEFGIFFIVFFAVLFLGTIYGILAGILLSFVTVIMRAADPPRMRLGYLPQKDAFYPLDRTSGTREIRHVVIYRFSGALFFANAGLLQEEIDEILEKNPDVRTIIIDASGISSIDVTAVERLLILYDRLKEQNIRLFLTEHTGDLNDQLRAFGADRMFRDGAIRRRITEALRVADVHKPYDLCAPDETGGPKGISDSMSHADMAEFEWAYGSEAEEKMKELADDLAARIARGEEISGQTIEDAEKVFFGGKWTEMDEEKFIELLEFQLSRWSKDGRIDPAKWKEVRNKIFEYHMHLDQRVKNHDDQLLQMMIARRIQREQIFRERYPEAYRTFKSSRDEFRRSLKELDPDLYEEIQHVREKEGVTNKE